MCGIAGIINFDGRPATRDEIEHMTRMLQHRGPDGGQVWRDGPCALGHRRLSVIDPQGGAQPISNEDGTVWVTYNGELYNFVALRQELERSGHIFKTRSDTEVLVHAWEEWGEQCVERFRGMFAFAIADARRRKVFLARDHLGIKPLYYFRTDQRLAFASELQALRSLLDFPGEIDQRSIDYFLRLTYIPPPRTIYADVCKLSPAHRLTVNFDGFTRGPEAYWKLAFRPEAGVSREEWIERLEAELRDSVRAHLVSDVPFGSFLSGGIDSTAIVTLMAEEMSEPVKTFSIGFEETDFSELEYARAVARQLGTDHREEIVRPDAISILPELVRHYGEPFGDSSAIPTYYVSRLARHHVPMVLTGDGGDEALLGYDRYASWLRWIHPDLPKRASWKRAIRPALRRLAPVRFREDVSLREAKLKDWLGRVPGTGDAVRSALWRPELAAAMSPRLHDLDDVENDAKLVQPEQFGQYVDYRTYLPHDILTKVDIASMCHGLETRTPLVDVRIAEFAGTIPWEMNLRRNADGIWTGKSLLKALVARKFGTDFVQRKKTGFSVPLNHWFAEGGMLRQELEDRLSAADAGINRYFQPKAVRGLIGEHGVGARDYSTILWQLLFFENWLEHVDRPAHSKPQPYRIAALGDRSSALAQ